MFPSIGPLDICAFLYKEYLNFQERAKLNDGNVPYLYHLLHKHCLKVQLLSGWNTITANCNHYNVAIDTYTVLRLITSSTTTLRAMNVKTSSSQAQ